MKLLIAILLFGTQVLAADLNLRSGETATIQANTLTRVTCDGGGGSGFDCPAKANLFEKNMARCQQSYTVDYCISQLWSKWKTANPNCIAEGSEVCITKCSSSYTWDYCNSRCS